MLGSGLLGLVGVTRQRLLAAAKRSWSLQLSQLDVLRRRPD